MSSDLLARSIGNDRFRLGRQTLEVIPGQFCRALYYCKVVQVVGIRLSGCVADVSSGSPSFRYSLRSRFTSELIRTPQTVLLTSLSRTYNGTNHPDVRTVTAQPTSILSPGLLHRSP